MSGKQIPKEEGVDLIMKISYVEQTLVLSAKAHMNAALWAVRKQKGTLLEELAKLGTDKTEEQITNLVENFKPFSLNLIGEAGIGKTEIVKAVATYLHIPVYVFNPSQWVDNSDIQGMPLKEKINGRWRTLNALPEFFPDYSWGEGENSKVRRVVERALSAALKKKVSVEDMDLNGEEFDLYLFELLLEKNEFDIVKTRDELKAFLEIFEVLFEQRINNLVIDAMKHLRKQLPSNGKQSTHKYTEAGGVMVNYAANRHYIQNYEEVNKYWFEKFPEKYADNPDEAINEADGAMVFFDELNRVIAEDVKQALFQIFIEQKLTNYAFPKSTFLIAASNPNTTDYSVSPIFEERAFKDRFVHLFVENSLKDFNAYTAKNDFHWSIKAHVNQYPESLMKTGEEYDLGIIPSPRSWRFVNTIVQYTDLFTLERDVFVEVIAGVLGLEHAVKYIETLEKGGEKVPNGADILTNYDEVRDLILLASDNNRQDYMNQVKERFLEALQEKDSVHKYNLKAEKDVDGGFAVAASVSDKMGLQLRKDTEDSSVAYIKPTEALELGLTEAQLTDLGLMMVDNALGEKTFIKPNLDNIYKFFCDVNPEFRVAMIKQIIATSDAVHPVMAKHAALFEIVRTDIRNSNTK